MTAPELLPSPNSCNNTEIAYLQKVWANRHFFPPPPHVVESINPEGSRSTSLMSEIKTAGEAASWANTSGNFYLEKRLARFWKEVPLE